MEPFFRGMAIGLMLLVLLGIPSSYSLLSAAFFYGFFRAAFTTGLRRRNRPYVPDSPAASQPQP